MAYYVSARKYAKKSREIVGKILFYEVFTMEDEDPDPVLDPGPFFRTNPGSA